MTTSVRPMACGISGVSAARAPTCCSTDVLNRCGMKRASRHVCSEAGSSGGAGGALPGAAAAAAVPRQAAAASGTSPEAGKLFAKVVAAEHSAQHEAQGHLPHPSTARRIIGALGNALLLGGLGAGAFFGYYTYRYSPAEIDAMIDARSQPDAAEAAGPVSEVRCLLKGAGFDGGDVLAAKRPFEQCLCSTVQSRHR